MLNKLNIYKIKFKYLIYYNIKKEKEKKGGIY